MLRWIDAVILCFAAAGYGLTWGTRYRSQCMVSPGHAYPAAHRQRASVCHCILDNMRSDLSWNSSRVAMEHGMARCRTDFDTGGALKVIKVRPVTAQGCA
jgi:hypothetical protein